jgi:D-alanine-D-alanine ligase
MKKFRVALLANLKINAPTYDGMPEDRWDDLDNEKTVQVLVDAIRSAGHICEFVEGNLSLLDQLTLFRPDICFNICEGHFGDSREAQVPALLEMMRIPYTGSKVLTLALALDKPMTKRILHWHELPTPTFQTFERVDESLNDDLKFPLFAKPSREGTGMGVTGKSIIRNEAELREQVAYILARYKQPALVESYIEGREVTVGIVGNLIGPVARRLPEDEESPRIQAGLRFLPPMEVNLEPFKQTDVVYSNRLKVELAEDLDYLCPAPLDREMVEELNWLTAAVFRVTGALDVSRVDFRLDMHDNLKPYILEINPLPGLAPGYSDLVIEAQAEGIQHVVLVNMILDAALKRYGMIP